MTVISKSKDPSQEQVDWRAWAKSAILLGMGIYLTVLIVTGHLTNYINLRFAWLAYLAAAIFFLLGLVSLHRMLYPPPNESSPHHHSHSHITWSMLAVVALPLILAIAIPSRPLGVEAVNGGISLSPVGVDRASAFTRHPLDRNILDWLRELSRVQTPAELNGQPVDVIGFVYRQPDFADDEFMASRFTMSCCVADAYPIGLPVRSATASAFPTGAWVRVQGTIKASRFGADFAPVVDASQIDIVETPAQPYLYP